MRTKANDFLNSGFSKSSGWFKPLSPFKPVTVVVETNDGEYKEHHGIKSPWKYIAKCKQSPDVKNAWIKSE